MPETFTILDNGEQLITATWEPEPEQLALQLLRLANYYDNMLTPLLESQRIAIESTELHFETESDPSGVKWPPLDGWDEDGEHGGYLREKINAGYPEDEILVRTGAGKEAATSSLSWFVSEEALMFEPEGLPEYMKYHQAGTEHLGVERDRIAKKLAQNEKVTKEEGRIFAQGGQGKYLPQREFIGFGPDDIELFEVAWNEWFASGIEMIEEFPGGGSPITPMGSNVLGTFPIIGYTKRGQPMLRTPGGVRFGKLPR